MKLMEIYYDGIINKPFPVGLRDIPDNPILFRVLLLQIPDSVDDIDDYVNTISGNNLGQHYIADDDVDDDWLRDIGVYDRKESDDEVIMFKVKANKEDIDIQQTIRYRRSDPNEKEIQLKRNSSVEILDWWQLL